MKPLRALTPKQDAFISVWLTNGYNVTEAYRAAYNTANMNNFNTRREANLVLKSPSVMARIEELRQADPNIPEPQALEVFSTNRVPTALPDLPDKPDKAWLLQKAVQLWQMSTHTGNLGQIKAALELIGKITGDLVDRKELRVVRTWADLSDAEVAALAAGETIDGEIADPDC